MQFLCSGSLAVSVILSTGQADAPPREGGVARIARSARCTDDGVALVSLSLDSRNRPAVGPRASHRRSAMRTAAALTVAGATLVCTLFGVAAAASAQPI